MGGPRWSARVRSARSWSRRASRASTVGRCRSTFSSCSSESALRVGRVGCAGVGAAVGGGGTGAGAPPQGVGSPAWARGYDGAEWWAAVCAPAHVHAVRIMVWRRWEPMGQVCASQ